VDAEYLPFCLKGVPCFVENPYGTLRLCKFMLCLAEYLQVCSDCALCTSVLCMLCHVAPPPSVYAPFLTSVLYAPFLTSVLCHGLWLCCAGVGSPFSGVPLCRGVRACRLQVITYCSYGAMWMKRTCIWSWNTVWTARPVCKFRCLSCRKSFLLSGKHVHSSTIGGKQHHSRTSKYRVPEGLLGECLSSCPLRGPGDRPWVLDLCCGPNKCLQGIVPDTYHYVGVDHDQKGTPTSLRLGERAHYLCLDLSTCGFANVVVMCCCALGLSASDLQLVWFSPPCTRCPPLAPPASPAGLPVSCRCRADRAPVCLRTAIAP
jgi:hypothetical protein